MMPDLSPALGWREQHHLGEACLQDFTDAACMPELGFAPFAFVHTQEWTIIPK